MSTQARPNVLLIMTDQHSADALSCAGNPDLQTPAIDSLAGRGARFTRAYCTSPLCTPSRASMLSGRFPSEVGVNDNVPAVPETFPERSLGRIFVETGYDCAYAGKWHLPGIVHEGSGRQGGGERTSGFRQICSSAHTEMAEACRDFLAAGERRDRPFLLVASFNEPHGICEWARGQSPPSGEVTDVDWRHLPLLPPNFGAGSEEPEALRRVQDLALTAHPTQGWDETQWRRYRHAYFRLCERVDTEIETILAALDSTGLASSTAVVFTADHGDMQGAHRWNQKKVLFEEAVGVPFIVVPPAPAGAAHEPDALVSVGLDLLPTLCDFAGIPPDPFWTGRSMRPLAEGRTVLPVHDQVVCETEWSFPGLGPPPETAYLRARMVRTGRFTYLCHSWGPHREQLFDAQADPGQLTNLATSGHHQDVLADHRQRLIDHCVAVGDAFARDVPDPGLPPR